MRPRTLLAMLLGLAACAQPAHDGATDRSAAEARVEIEAALRTAYDLAMPDVASRMLALYADSGRVVSATSGAVTTSRDSLANGIRYFWENVGVNMREPRWVWDEMFIDVLSPTAAAVTATYRIPHRNPSDQPHVLGGAMTLVMRKQGSEWRVIQEHLSDLPQASSTNSTTPDESH